jgi:hypothetical protein
VRTPHNRGMIIALLAVLGADLTAIRRDRALGLPSEATGIRAIGKHAGAPRPGPGSGRTALAVIRDG